MAFHLKTLELSVLSIIIQDFEKFGNAYIQDCRLFQIYSLFSESLYNTEAGLKEPLPFPALAAKEKAPGNPGAFILRAALITRRDGEPHSRSQCIPYIPFVWLLSHKKAPGNPGANEF